MLTVVTSFSPSLYEQVGHRCVESFKRYWPEWVDLICYREGPRPESGIDLLEVEPCKSFLERHKDNPVTAGLKPHEKRPWGPKARAKGYNFKFDAYKFARKVFAVANAARVCRGKLFWLDADIVTHTPVPGSLLHELLPDDMSICHIPREGYHSETGFVGYNLNRPETREFLDEYERLYASDEFMDIPEWSDSFVLDWLIARRQPKTKAIPHTNRAQPFDNSVLGQYCTHLKGNRKLAA